MDFLSDEEGQMDDSQNVNFSQTSIISGYMIKRGRVFSSWNRRYFQLFATYILYYTDEAMLLSPRIFRLYPDMLVKDCALKSFCFCLKALMTSCKSALLLIWFIWFNGFHQY